MDPEPENLHHVPFHLANGCYRLRVVCRFGKVLDYGYEDLFYLSRHVNSRDSYQLELVWPIHPRRLLIELICVCKSHMECGPLESHISADFIHPTKESDSH